MGKMSFGPRWMLWMNGLIFNSTMLILANSSLTADFVVRRGLQQGDSLSSFLFLLAAKGLVVLVKNDVNLGKLSGFKVSDIVPFELLQFVDDTIVVCDRKWSNLWNLKVILRGFQMVFGLCVNMNKRRIFGVNVNQ